MKTKTTAIGAAVGLAAGAVAAWQRSRNAPRGEERHAPGGEEDGRWLVLTVNRSPVDVSDPLPKPLADLGDRVELQIRPAPGDKGTELAARLPGRGRDQELRAALRESKQLLEVGEVLRVDPQPAGDRAPTPWSKALAAVTERAGAKGVL